MKDERRWDRGASLTLAVAVGWLVICLAYALYVYQFPQDGWRYASNSDTSGVYKTELNMSGRPSPLQIDDLIVAIEGQPIVKGYPPAFPADLKPGQNILYTVQRAETTREPSSAETRGTEILDLQVELMRLRPDTLLRNTWGTLKEQPRDMIVSLVALLVVGFAFFLRPGNLGARFLFLIFSYYFVSSWIGFSISTLYSHTFPFIARYIYNVMGYSWYWAFFASLLLLPLAFPVVKGPLRRFPRLLPLAVYGFGLASCLILVYLALTKGQPVWDRLVFALSTAYLGLTVGSVFGSLIHDWRTVRDPVARAQLRWMTLGMGGGLGVPFGLALAALLVRGTFSGVSSVILWLLLLLPICLAIAITRYRLFDIDVVIRRTVIYAVVMALLALVFFGSVILLQRLFTGLTGQESPVAIVASTLVIAALFSPLRSRVNDFVDRRFYRRKYDAQQVLIDFAQTTRNETHLDSLTGELIRVVAKTLQPERINVSLRATGDHQQRTTATAEPAAKGIQR